MPCCVHNTVYCFRNNFLLNPENVDQEIYFIIFLVNRNPTWSFSLILLRMFRKKCWMAEMSLRLDHTGYSTCSLPYAGILLCSHSFIHSMFWLDVDVFVHQGVWNWIYIYSPIYVHIPHPFNPATSKDIFTIWYRTWFAAPNMVFLCQAIWSL